MEPKSNHLGYWSNAIVAAQLTCGLNGFQKPDFGGKSQNWLEEISFSGF